MVVVVTATVVGGWVAVVVVAAAARGLRGQMMRVTQGVRLYMRVLYSIYLVFFIHKHHYALGSSAKSFKKCKFNST